MGDDARKMKIEICMRTEDQRGGGREGGREGGVKVYLYLGGWWEDGGSGLEDARERGTVRKKRKSWRKGEGKEEGWR